MHAPFLRIARPLLAIALAAAGGQATAIEYTAVDTAASRIAFHYTQMGVAMDGRFGRFDATLNFDPARPETARATLELPLATIDAGSPEANQELAGKLWFDSARFPLARFESTAVKPLGGNRYQLEGRLTIKGRTQALSTPVSVTQNGPAARVEGAFAIQRADFAIGEGMWADFGTVANEIRVQFSLSATAGKPVIPQPLPANPNRKTNGESRP